jgi:hypothetical protein
MTVLYISIYFEAIVKKMQRIFRKKLKIEKLCISDYFDLENLLSNINKILKIINIFLIISTKRRAFYLVFL